MTIFVGQIAEDGLLAKRELNTPAVLHFVQNNFCCSEMGKEICGIYKIQSKIKPERIYIGSAVDIYTRWANHKCKLKKEEHHSIKLQRHFNKYGIDDLLFSIIIICDRNDLVPINGIVRPEQFFIWAYNPYFNVSPFAGSPMMGMKHSEETKKKFKNRIITNETRRKMSDSQKRIGNRPPSAKGTKHTEEHNRKISKANKGNKNWLGKKHSPETREKMSKSGKGNKHNYGHKQTEEHIRKRMESTRITKERNAKIVPWNKGLKAETDERVMRNIINRLKTIRENNVRNISTENNESAA